MSNRRITKYENNEASDQFEGAMRALRMLIHWHTLKTPEMNSLEFFNKLENLRDKHLEGMKGRVSREFAFGFKSEVNMFLSNIHDYGEK